MSETKTDFPEAGAIVYFYYKRTDGFEVSLTLRDETGKTLMKRLDGAIEVIKKEGGIPLPLRGGFSGVKKPLETVPGRVCPLCKNPLVYATTKAGKRFIKCSMNKWNAQTKQPEGCKFIEWPDAITTPIPDIPERQIKQDAPPPEGAEYYNDY